MGGECLKSLYCMCVYSIIVIVYYVCVYGVYACVHTCVSVCTHDVEHVWKLEDYL